MKVIGMCGGSGSGKGTACAFFEELGIKIIDTDRLYHDLTSSDSACLREITLAFGREVISNNSLDRRALANIVFSSADKLDLLNKISHKHILSEVRRLIADHRENGVIGVIVDAPVLFESGFNIECDSTIAVCADTDIRVERIISRDNISKERALARIQAQKSDEWLKSKCDYYIENNTTTDDLKASVNIIANKIFDI